MKWIGQGYPVRFGRKKDIPNLGAGYSSIRVEFRFEKAWIMRDLNGCVLFPNGWSQCVDFYLNTPGHVIGLRDRMTAYGYPWSQEWIAAMDAKISDELALRK